MHGRDDEAVLVVGDRHDLVHVLDLLALQADLGGDGLVEHALDGLGAHVGAHRQHALQAQRDRLLVAGGQQVGEILERNAQRAHVGHGAVAAHLAGLGRRLDRRQRRHVPDHRQRAVFGMQREGDLPLHRHLPHRRFLGGFQPGVRHAVGARLRDHLRIVGIEEDVELRLIEVLLVLDAGRLLDAVGVVEHDAEVADAPDAGLRAHRRLAGLDARIAEDALLGFAARPVVVDLLVGAARHAHAPAAALVLVDQDDAVLLALVDGAGRAGRDARRVEAVLAQPRQVHHEGVLELAVDLLLHAFEVVGPASAWRTRRPGSPPSSGPTRSSPCARR